MLLSEVNTMMIPPNEDVLVLAERWLKLLSDLGLAQATLSVYRSALSHYFVFCSQKSIELENTRLKTWRPTLALSYPACLFPRPAPRSSSAFLRSVSGTTF